MTPAAYLFDLDGTLIDSENSWVRAILAWLEDRGMRGDAVEVANNVFGHSWPDIRRWLYAQNPGLPRSTEMEDAIALRRYHDALGLGWKDLAIESSCEFFLKCAAIAPCCIVSGSPRSEILAFARECALDGALSFALGPEDYERGKPAPDGYLAAASRLGVPIGKCMVIEDSTPGISAGVAAGALVLGLNRSPTVKPDFTGCIRVVENLAEVDPANPFPNSDSSIQA